jgi:hypothetical protein
MRRIMDVEEGVRILTRVTDMIENKMETTVNNLQAKEFKVNEAEESSMESVNISKIIAKYQKWPQIKDIRGSP